MTKENSIKVTKREGGSESKEQAVGSDVREAEGSIEMVRGYGNVPTSVQITLFPQNESGNIEDSAEGGEDVAAKFLLGCCEFCSVS